MPFHEVLGRKWIAYQPVAEVVASWRPVDPRTIYMPSAEARCRQIEQSTFYPALRHLGFEPISDELVREQVELGVDLAVDYFCEPWWRTEALTTAAWERVGFFDPARIADEQERLLRQVDKSRPDRELKWYEAFTSALFLCALAGRWDDLSRICGWFDRADIEPEYCARTIEDEYQLSFVCIGCALQPEPPAGYADLAARIEKCRAKRPRLLMALWRSIEDGDQSRFSKSLRESVDAFLAKPEQTGEFQKWVDLHRSALLMIAERRGLACPDLADRQRAALVTPETAGMTSGR